MFSVTTEEGQKKYGRHYLGHGHLTALHNSDGGYKYHGNLFFLTSHPAFQLKIERSLRAVKRGVDCPYWDFMADANLGALCVVYGGCRVRTQATHISPRYTYHR